MLPRTDGRSRGAEAVAGEAWRRPGSHCFVVPAFGESPFIGDCLRSLRNQSSPARVVITTSTPCRFIDDAATAHGVDVAVNPVRGGIASDWNFALNATDARFVTLAHQDDIYAADFLDRTLAAFDQHEGSLCFTGQVQIDDAGCPRTSKISLVKRALALAIIGRRARPSTARLRAFLSFGNPLPCSSVTFDRLRLPGFVFSPNYESNLDWDAWWRLVGMGESFLSIPDPLVGRRHNGQTATARLIASGQRGAEDRMMFQRIWPGPVADAAAAVYRLSY